MVFNDTTELDLAVSTIAEFLRDSDLPDPMVSTILMTLISSVTTTFSVRTEKIVRFNDTLQYTVTTTFSVRTEKIVRFNDTLQYIAMPQGL